MAIFKKISASISKVFKHSETDNSQDNGQEVLDKLETIFPEKQEKDEDTNKINNIDKQENIKE